MKKKQKRQKKIKITAKLTICFMTTIIMFTIVLGMFFLVLFREYTIDMHKESMKQTAKSIATVMDSVIHDNTTDSKWEAFSDKEESMPPDVPDKSRPQGSVYIDGPRLIQLIKEISEADVWLIDSKYTILTTSFDSKTEYSSRYVFEELPVETKNFIKKIYADGGYEVFGESFSVVFEEDYISVGVPIFTPRGEVTGAVILHMPNSTMKEAIESGYYILFASLSMALAIGIFISILISRTIARPLKKINMTALMISEGDYSVKTNVKGSDEIGELAKTMDEMGEKLQQAEQESEKLEKMRRDFVANISHELRTPVTVIRGSMEALCDGVVSDPEKVAEYHSQLLCESIYMQRMVNDLLDLSRLQNPDFSINITEFNLYDCVNDAVRAGKRIAAQKNINIDFRYDNNVYFVKGDYDRIRQMLLIIIDNGIKFTDNAENPVIVDLKENSVSITNIGKGIDPEELPLIFERFYKSRSEQNKNGTGLGLPIAKQIASRHQIGLTVSSVEGGKTTFKFVFPTKM